jgi:hypothetical protein
LHETFYRGPDSLRLSQSHRYPGRLDIFDRCKVVFEYVVRKLTEAKREDEAYIESMRKLK